MTVHSGFYRVYNAGKFDGKGEDHFMFMCYSRERQPGQASLVPASEAASHRQALIDIGYRPLPIMMPAGGERRRESVM